MSDLICFGWWSSRDLLKHPFSNDIISATAAFALLAWAGPLLPASACGKSIISSGSIKKLIIFDEKYNFSFGCIGTPKCFGPVWLANWGKMASSALLLGFLLSKSDHAPYSGKVMRVAVAIMYHLNIRATESLR